MDQLLEIARNDESTSFYASEKKNAVNLMKEIIQRQQLVATERGVKIDFKHPNKVMASEINSFFGSTILDNLLSNALKYSHENGKVIIDFDSNGDTLVCKIQDFGIGIKQEDLIHIFQPFFRSDALNHKSIKGTGLGLSIVQKSAKAIGANVTVESVEGLGTTFDVQFPKSLREC